MEDKDKDLDPTLWRTCRVLANERRWYLLGYIIKFPDHKIKDIAQLSGNDEFLCGQELRKLQSRGLITARKDAGVIFYSAQANSKIDYADELLAGVKYHHNNHTPYSKIHPFLTAFTYSRRIKIVRELIHESKPSSELRSNLGIPKVSFYRQIAKLTERGIIYKDGNCYSLNTIADPLYNCLISTIADDKNLENNPDRQ